VTPQIDLNMARTFAAIALLFGLPLVFVTPPFQIPDEWAHFYRAYQVSEGHFVAPAPHGIGGADLPASLPILREHFAKSHFQPRGQISSKILSALTIPLYSDDRRYVQSPNAIYSPLPYAPQAIAIGIGRQLNLAPLRLMYLGRLANLLCFVILGCTSLSIVPAFRRPIFLILVMPMMLDLAASLSADVMTDSLAILLAATILRECGRETAISTRAQAAIALLAAGVTLAKLAYFPLSGLVLLIPASRFGERKARWLFVLVILALTAATESYWASRTAGLNAKIHWTAGAPEQFAMLLHQPLRIFSLTWHTLERETGRLVLSFFGSRLGRMDVKTFRPFVQIYMFLMAWSVWPTPDDPSLPRPPRLEWVIAFSAGSALAAAALLNYLFWTPPGSSSIEGLQGRQLIPISPAIVMLLGWELARIIPRRWWDRSSSPSRQRIVVSAGVASGAVTLLTIYFRSYG
jgi:uncharacterized membrane protein